MAKEEELSGQLSIILEYLASLSDRISKLEKKELSNSIEVDTEGNREVEHRRSPSLSNIGLKVEEGNLENSGEDRIKQIIKHCSEVILQSAPDYITNK